MDEAEAKKLLESLKELQEDNNELHFPCPRCGCPMLSPMSENFLSRYADVYICPMCGTDEGVRAANGMQQMPLNYWYAITDYLT